MSVETKPYIIVLGNEKGGTGKSTVTMHVITALLWKGYKVGSIDVDARQGTLSRYVENRQHRVQQSGLALPLPTHIAVFRSNLESATAARQEEEMQFTQALEQLHDCHFIVIDTPGSDTHLSRLAHSYANTLITPLNDSFIDLDMLVRLAPDSLDILRPSTYAEMVWDQKKQRAMRDGGKIDWIVLRNRLASIHSRNREEMERVLGALSKRIGFRLLPGFGERVIFRELFLNGLTLLDMRETGTPMTLSHVAAKQELTDLLDRLNLPPALRDQAVA
ncbi:division plane positioning ATPase MipZ [Candidatus Odyssella acanthamoebae]|uniref:ATPase n=1 Tax=Candidatus Odyssella acanthamoebae TaxID=91604 RepID=A0A077AX65_9PROT|nr:division plane positioning ATPase MipZ [Candidatus Paracaedibacter acanthamoebae]AIK97191.1 ATPase [Candidatus Paracaedibacter acanthamoebae]